MCRYSRNSISIQPLAHAFSSTKIELSRVSVPYGLIPEHPKIQIVTYSILLRESLHELLSHRTHLPSRFVTYKTLARLKYRSTTVGYCPPVAKLRLATSRRASPIIRSFTFTLLTILAPFMFLHKRLVTDKNSCAGQFFWGLLN